MWKKGDGNGDTDEHNNNNARAFKITLNFTQLVYCTTYIQRIFLWF